MQRPCVVIEAAKIPGNRTAQARHLSDYLTGLEGRGFPRKAAPAEPDGVPLIFPISPVA